jgi:serine/threonine protein kinase
MKNVKGGKAIASGAYGCVFRPALKCKNSNERTKGISKLMESEEANLEMDEMESIVKHVKSIPNAEKYFVVNGINMCEPSSLNDEDKVDFDSICQNLVDININSSNINSNLDDLSIINMPDLGIDLATYIKTKSQFSEEEFKKFNTMMINLIQNGVVAMNNNNVIHHDLKDTNIMVDVNGNTIIIDWGFAGVSTANEPIPKNVLQRPFQYNTAFSSMLINNTFVKEYNKACNKTNSSGLNKQQNEEFLKLYLKYHLRRNAGHANYLKQLLTSLNSPKSFEEMVIEYNSEILDNFTNGCNFEMEKYFKQVYLFNVDIWGVCTTFLYFLKNKSSLNDLSPDLSRLALKNYNEILFDICFVKGDKKINVEKIIDLLMPLSDFSPSQKSESKTIIDLTSSPKSTPYDTTDIRKSVHSGMKERSLINSRSNQKSQTLKVKRKRCPNGSRRNPKTKKCTIYKGEYKGTVVNSIKK